MSNIIDTDYKADKSVREIQMLELEILKKIMTFCENNSLNYSLCAGSLLGSIRHKGFIPWDDDIDVMMPRPDYEKLIEITRSQPIGSELKIISGDYNDDFSLPFIKVFDENILLHRQHETHLNEGENLAIDVFPVDGLGDDYNKAKKIFKKAYRLHKSIARASSIPWKRREGEKGLVGWLKCLYRYFFTIPGYNYYKKKMIELVRKNNFYESKYVALATWGVNYGIGEIQKNEEFIKYETNMFEGIEVRIIGCWDSYLKGAYGNYMELPPEEERVCPHSFKIEYRNVK